MYLQHCEKASMWTFMYFRRKSGKNIGLKKTEIDAELMTQMNNKKKVVRTGNPS